VNNETQPSQETAEISGEETTPRLASSVHLATFPDWQFDLSGSVSREDNDDEQFKGADSNTQSLAREVVAQNGPDRQLHPDIPVRIRYMVSGPDRGVPKNIALRYFAGLQKHLDVCDSKSTLHPHALEEVCEYILIEDFQTTGVTGDVTKRSEPAGSGNNFHGLFRSAGKTSKSSGGGSWGVGKRVVNVGSAIGTFIGYSVRYCREGQVDPYPRVLMGRAILTTHSLDDVDYSVDGFLAEWSDRFPMPITDDARLDDFVRDWRITRSKNQPGLSTVIPYTKENIESDPLAHAFYIAAESYGQILSGRLEVELDLPNVSEFLNRESLASFVERMSATESDFPWQELLKRVRLAQWALSDDGKASTLVLPEVTSPMKLDDFVSSLSNESKEKIAARFAEAGRLVLEIPTRVNHTPTAGPVDELSGHLSVVLERDVSSNEGIYPEYFRNWIRIGVGHRSRTRNERAMGRRISQIRTLVFVNDKPNGAANGLARLLRACEGIAHAKWDTPKGGWKEWPKGEFWMQFTKSAPRSMSDLARGATSTMNYNAFPFFSAAHTEGSPVEQPVDGPVTEPPPLPPPQPSFRIRRNPRTGVIHVGVPDDAGQIRAKFVAGYQTRDGNAIKNWSPADFKFDDLKVEITGGRVIRAADNELVFEVLDAKTFQLSIDGFDKRRDIDAKVEQLDEEEDE
jgi:hypothetical protein